MIGAKNTRILEAVLAIQLRRRNMEKKTQSCEPSCKEATHLLLIIKTFQCNALCMYNALQLDT